MTGKNRGFRSQGRVAQWQSVALTRQNSAGNDNDRGGLPGHVGPVSDLCSRRGPTAGHDVLIRRIAANCMPVPWTGCWLWEGAASAKGYGRIRYGGKLHSPHRIVLEHKLGRVMPRSEDTRHTCDVGGCVNPDHLIPGSRSDNVQDMVRRGRKPPVRISPDGRERIRESNRRRARGTS